MKKLYIRFFLTKTAEIPLDSRVVCSGEVGCVDALKAVADWNTEVLEWVTNHMDGRVDFVWL